ncbi:MAG: AAA family ATPase [Lachnospiraceae bacterium]|jgi:CO dehydrogenase maturation factor|nr:AAA family ATPase [Lachnospiraceae bacterium]MBQ3906371.1 AAA family ATPase [Lachnospiraceae bacterium]
MKKTKILALVGKGGVGKTSICSAFVRILSEKCPQARILAIDADPAVGLATALGVEVRETLDDLRLEIIEKAAQGAGKEAIELLGEVRYRIFDALIEKDGFSFLAIGRPEGAGCYCAVNAYLKEVIEMISKDFDYVVIDGEAGIEQVNRRVMEQVTHLFFITDGSKKGMQVIRSIKQVADELVTYEKCGVIINRVDDPELFSDLEIPDMDVLSVIESDGAHAKNDILGKTIFELPADAPVLRGSAKALEQML